MAKIEIDDKADKGLNYDLRTYTSVHSVFVVVAKLNSWASSRE